MTGSIDFLSLNKTHDPMRLELHEAARRVIDSGLYVNGPEGRAFAAELADALGLGEVVPVSNGLDALRLILRGYIELGRLRAGDEVLVPANTYIASVLPIVEFGLRPVLVMPDADTYGLDWNHARRLVSERTRAVMTVHLYGTPSWNFEVADELRRKGIILIEDNAQAIGARARRDADSPFIFTGALGDAAAFSFYPTKNIGALGDAGAVATADPELAGVVRALANYGSTERYHNKFTGYNCRMDEMQAALLRVKLRHLDATSARRRAAAFLYTSLIKNSRGALPARVLDTEQVWHQYVVRFPFRDALRDALAGAGIATDIHYPVALADQECFSRIPEALSISPEALAESRSMAAEVLSLPVANVSPLEIERIVEVVNGFTNDIKN